MTHDAELDVLSGRFRVPLDCRHRRLALETVALRISSEELESGAGWSNGGVGEAAAGAHACRGTRVVA